MTVSLEVRLERMDSKLEKHIGVTETILKNQQRTLEEIRDIVKIHSDKFITREEAELLANNAVHQQTDDVDDKLAKLEARIHKVYATIGSVVVTVLATIATVFGFSPKGGG